MRFGSPRYRGRGWSTEVRLPVQVEKVRPAPHPGPRPARQLTRREGSMGRGRRQVERLGPLRHLSSRSAQPDDAEGSCRTARAEEPPLLPFSRFHGGAGLRDVLGQAEEHGQGVLGGADGVTARRVHDHQRRARWLPPGPRYPRPRRRGATTFSRARGGEQLCRHAAGAPHDQRVGRSGTPPAIPRRPDAFRTSTARPGAARSRSMPAGPGGPSPGPQERAGQFELAGHAVPLVRRMAAPSAGSITFAAAARRPGRLRRASRG